MPPGVFPLGRRGEKMNNRAFSDNLRLLAEWAGLSMAAISERARLTPETMHKLLSCQRQPTAYAAYRIARAIGCTMEDLLNGIEDE
jgi:transcriptional regulator with XRE-family HTH domain